MNQSLEPPEPMILTSSYELHPCLVVIGQNQPFPTAKVLSSNQEDNEPKVLCSDQGDNELLATLRESFKRLINLGLDLALQDTVLLQHLYTGLDNIAFGGVFLSLSISGARFVLISRHTPCTNLHDKPLEVKKESSPKLEEEVFIATLQTLQSHDLAIHRKPVVIQNHLREEVILPIEILSNDLGRSINFPLHERHFSTYSLNLFKKGSLWKRFKSNPFEGHLERLKDGMSSDAIEGETIQGKFWTFIPNHPWQLKMMETSMNKEATL
jgi:hypothetical protein